VSGFSRTSSEVAPGRRPTGPLRRLRPTGKLAPLILVRSRRE